MLRTIVERIRNNFAEEVAEADIFFDDGFLDWFDTDISRGFHVYDDEEVAAILKMKVEKCVHDPARSDYDVLKMFFYQSTPARSVEVNYNSPYHEKLVKELERPIPREGRARENKLARIRYAAKKIGMRPTRGTDGRNTLATDIRVVWRDGQGNICG